LCTSKKSNYVSVILICLISATAPEKHRRSATFGIIGAAMSTKQTKRHVQILLFSGREDIFDSLIIRGLKEKAGDKYDFDFVTAFKASEILKLAQTYEFDMFILYLNNIPFHLDNFPVGSHLEGPLQLVTHLKTTYRRPVVAFSSMADLEEEKVKRAGADFYFLTPYKVEDFLEAMIICLGRLSR
jgi:CheY-like chemotaxis protein